VQIQAARIESCEAYQQDRERKKSEYN
jgi:hypothetical protein